MIYQPYNDNIMTYDFKAHRYVLTEYGIFEKLGINLDSVFGEFEDDVRVRRKERFLKKVSDSVYGYIYQDNANDRYIEYVLAMNPTLRQSVEEMLIEQAEYVLDGNNFLQDFSGVNIAKGSAMKKEDLRGEMRVALRVVELCNSFIGDLPFTLKTIRLLPNVPCGYREGY